MGVRVANVVFDVEDAATAARIADLYAALLGMERTSRGASYRAHGWPADEGDDVDPLVLDDDPARPNLAFEWPEAGAGYRRPRWGDPERPAQLHLDLEVPDPDAADEVVRRHGGELLAPADGEGRRVYADAGGHPFCVVQGPVARVARIVIDGDDPDALARFWSGLVTDGPALAFQRTDGVAPAWPDPRRPQQVHLDLDLDDDEDPAVVHERALALGAVRLPYLGGGHVFADPFGHPFCLGE